MLHFNGWGKTYNSCPRDDVRSLRSGSRIDGIAYSSGQKTMKLPDSAAGSEVCDINVCPEDSEYCKNKNALPNN